MKNSFVNNKVVKRSFCTKRALVVALSCGIFCLSAVSSIAGPREQAKRIHERLTGLPPDELTLTQMASDITTDGNGIQAALDVMNGVYGNAPVEGFLGGTLKRMAAPWTNRDQDPFEPLNDYMATFIGLVKDEADFRRILWDDVVYIHPGITNPSYSANNNEHYAAIETQAAALRQLTAIPQSSVQPIPAAATAGVMTSRAGARAFFYLGTNRAMLRFTLMSQTCRDLEQMEDINGVPDRIRQDVSRSPGGDSRLFLTGCVGCHIGMDPLAQAFAYYNYVDADEDPSTDDGVIVYNTAAQPNPELGIDTLVQPKYHINANNFPYGYVTPDDSWDNYWREGQNEALGWNYGGGSPDGFGNGAKTMGMELANSYAFAQCQVKKVFNAVCLREAGVPGNVNSTADHDEIAAMTTRFRDGGYNLKQVFAETANYCKGI